MKGLTGRARENLRQAVQLVQARRRRGPGSPMPRVLLPFGILAALFVALACLVLDSLAAEYYGRWPAWLSVPARWMTDVGLSGWYLAPAALILLILSLLQWRGVPPRRLLRLSNWAGLALYIMLSVGVSGLFVTTVKRLIGRARPHAGEGPFSFDPLSGNTYASFPSGHSTTVGAMTAVLFLCLPRMRFPIMVLGLWFAFTRVIVGAHFPSDILAGFSLGFGFAVLMASIFARLGFVFRQDGRGLPGLRRSFFL